MKVLFIWTDIETRIESGVIHIGVAYLSAALKKAGHKTALIRVMEPLGKGEVLKRVRDFHPDLVAFSVMTNQFDYCIQLAGWIKEEFDLPVIFGGHHPTLVPDLVIAEENVDMLCRGEGEETLVKLADRIAEGRDYSDIHNLWTKHNDRIIKNDVSPPIAELNRIAFMDLDIYNLNAMFPKEGINLHIMAGRGCPYSCTYCCNPVINRLYRDKGKVVRQRDVSVVIDELKHHIGNYPRINYFTFQDETFTLNKDWVLEFCEVYGRDISLPFSTMARVNHLDKEVLCAMKSAGCDLLRIGVESGSEWLREHTLNRKMTNEQIIWVFDYADKIGIRTWAFAMFGLPHETPEMVEETITFLRRLNPNQVQLSIFYPYPGTYLYDECVREGWLTDEKSLSYFEKSILKLPTISQDQILNYYHSFHRELIEIGAKKESRGIYDFISHFDEAQIRTDDERFVRLTTFFEEYPERFWLQAHPFAEISYEVDLIKNSRLVFDIAMGPDTYDKEGNGVKFEITQDGKKIFSKSLNPKKKKKDRGWFHYELPLKGEGPSRLVFRTQVSARSNNYFCAAGWGRPHLCALS